MITAGFTNGTCDLRSGAAPQPLGPVEVSFVKHERTIL
jgi:hypothetical protein